MITALLTRPETTPDWVGLDIKALPELRHRLAELGHDLVIQQARELDGSFI